MKYILNETPIRTTNNFRMNDIKLDLELPTSTSFKSFNGYENIRYEYDREIKSPLGFNTKGTYAYIDINESKDIILECNSDIICNTIINIDKNIETTITIKYTGDNYNIQNIIVNASENSNVTINYINMSNAISLISFENKVEENSTVSHNLYDLSGNIRVYKYNSDNSGDNSSSYLNNIYLADNQTFGTLIDKWENTRPIPKIDPELEDVDKIGLYLDVFFKGHLAKMMGMKNGLSRLYDKFIKKYTVTKPEYEDEDDSEALFDAIFGTPSNMDKD